MTPRHDPLRLVGGAVLLLVCASGWSCASDISAARQVVTADLSQSITDALKAGTKPKVWITLFGKKGEFPVHAVSAKALVVSFQNNALPLNWAQMSNDELVTVATSFAGEHGGRLFLAGKVAMACGFEKEALDLFAKAGVADPTVAAQAKEWAAKLRSAAAAAPEGGRPPVPGDPGIKVDAAMLKGASSVVVRVEEAAGVARSAWPLTFGVPFAPAQLSDPATLAVVVNGKASPACTEVAAKWKDGSVKWLHIDTQADLPASGTAELSVTWNSSIKPPAPAKLAVSAANGCVNIDTGALAFVLTPQGGGIPEQIKLNGKSAGMGGGRHTLGFVTSGPELNPPESRGNWKRSAPEGAKAVMLPAGPAQVSIEQQNALRATIKVSGWYEGEGRKACKYDVRVTAFAGKPFVRIQHTFTYTEDPASFFIRQIGLHFNVEGVSAAEFGGEGTAVLKADPAKGAYLLAAGPAVQYNGVTLAQAAERKTLFEVFEGDASTPIAKGQEPSGYAGVSGKSGGLSLGLRDLRLLHPKELAVDATGATVWLWPEHGGLLADCRNSGYGQRIRGETTLNGVGSGWAKTHELYVCYRGNDAAGAKQGQEVACAAQEPAYGAVDPQQVCDSGAMGVLAPVDRKTFPGMERQHDTLWAWVRKNQEVMRWDGIFDYGGVLIEFDNHAQRYSNGPGGTWCWRDYAGWILNDGQIAHHIWRGFARSGERAYARLAEEVSRNIGDVTTVHYQNPSVNGAHPVGGAHRHDMLPWGAIVTTYGMDVLGNCDLWYLTADLRAREVLKDYADNLSKGGPGLIERHGMASLLYRLSEALSDPSLIEKAKAQTQGDVQEAARPNFRSWTDLYMPMILAVDIAPDDTLKKALLAEADGLCSSPHQFGAEVTAWAFLQTKDAKYLDGMKACLTKNENMSAAAASEGDPWKDDWPALRKRMNQMPAWYVKIYINAQFTGRYPSAIRALKAANLDEKAVAK